jgi:hypothetical protein
MVIDAPLSGADGAAEAQKQRQSASEKQKRKE